jgi:hypothetical protein
VLVPGPAARFEALTKAWCILQGKQQFVVQLNLQRGEKKRRGVEVSSVKMPFDDKGFNFLKIKLEVGFAFVALLSVRVFHSCPCL